MPKTITKLNLVKYQNRKLYCKEWSAYTTLQEIRSAIHEGISIEVRQCRTGADVTSEVFAEILRLVAPQAAPNVLASIIVSLDNKAA